MTREQSRAAARTHPLLEVAVHGAAGDGDVLIRVDGPVAGALHVELVRQALQQHTVRSNRFNRLNLIDVHAAMPAPA